MNRSTHLWPGAIADQMGRPIDAVRRAGRSDRRVARRQVAGGPGGGVLAGTLVTFMIVLRRLDLLRWDERVTIWEPTTRLFRNMGSNPYVPRQVIDGRTLPAHWTRTDRRLPRILTRTGQPRL